MASDRRASHFKPRSRSGRRERRPVWVGKAAARLQGAAGAFEITSITIRDNNSSQCKTILVQGNLRKRFIDLITEPHTSCFATVALSPQAKQLHSISEHYLHPTANCRSGTASHLGPGCCCPLPSWSFISYSNACAETTETGVCRS